MKKAVVVCCSTVVAIVAATTLLLMSACKSSSNPSASSAPQTESTHEIVVGVVASLTGPEATFGISSKQGAEMAADEVNQAGGIKGKKIRLAVLDDQSKPEEAATVMTRLISQDKVVAVLGEVASSRSLAMAPIAQRNGIPMITPSSTNPKVTQIGDYIFRTCFTDPFQGPVMAKFIVNELKLKKAAIFTDIRNDYSIGLTKFFKEKFIELGGQVVSEQSYSAGDIDFKAQLTAIRSTKPEVVFLPGYYTDVGLIVRQARELKIDVPFTGGDGWDSPKLIEIGGKAVEGNYFVNHYSEENKDPVVQNFIAAYKARYNVVPDALAPMGYDAAHVLFKAMQQAASLNGKDLRDAIAATKEHAGVTGKISFDANRDASKPAVIIKIENQKLRFMTAVEP